METLKREGMGGRNEENQTRCKNDWIKRGNGKISNMRYTIWNNKGGVGKTFLTFILACEYAIKYPEKQVIILDLCPQANVSEIVLGGNGKGSAKLRELLSEKKRKTIGGYFDERIRSPHKNLGNEADYLLDRTQKFNSHLPLNVHLVVGDPSLEIQAQAINQIGAQTLPPDSWANVHRWLIDLIDGIKSRYSDAVFFIDCNPSFAAYTELAMLASDRVIVPCTADGSSARAIDNLGQLLYGQDIPVEYSSINFSTKAKNNGFALPSIHIISLNRSTQFNQRASRAFSAMFEEIKKRVNHLDQKGIAFSLNTHERFIEVPDSHSVSIVCSYEGTPLSNLKVGLHRVHELDVMVNPEPLERYTDAINSLISKL